MIDQALILFKTELLAYLSSKGDNAASVIIDNIGLGETSGGNGLPDNIVISLVNIEEESTLKNQSPLRRMPDGSAFYENPAIYINLYVLITCNYAGEGYLLALKRLSMVIRFLQSKSSFSSSNPVNINPIDPDHTEPFQFNMELFTLSFEQINYLWGSLGGRQVPFAMYKLRLISLSENVKVRNAPLIEEIETKLSKIN